MSVEVLVQNLDELVPDQAALHRCLELLDDSAVSLMCFPPPRAAEVSSVRMVLKGQGSMSQQRGTADKYATELPV